MYMYYLFLVLYLDLTINQLRKVILIRVLSYYYDYYSNQVITYYYFEMNKTYIGKLLNSWINNIIITGHF